jgi:mRNA-degrading endonuclease RelE of RelBE toxin-antitoxin system
MVRVSLSPEGFASLRRLPESQRTRFDRLLLESQRSVTLRLPGEYDTHPLEGGRGLWTLKVGLYRGIFHWDGAEARFIRFGHRATVYQRLPK